MLWKDIKNKIKIPSLPTYVPSALAGENLTSLYLKQAISMEYILGSLAVGVYIE